MRKKDRGRIVRLLKKDREKVRQIQRYRKMQIKAETIKEELK